MAVIETRRFTSSDAPVVAKLIATTMWTTNRKDYSADFIKNTLSHLQPADLVQAAQFTHFYVFIKDQQIVACGAIGPYWQILHEASLFKIFVHPDYQHQGIGRQIITTLETDSYFLQATRIEVPASITALSFYQKMGYHLKAGHTQPDAELLYRLEKFHTPTITVD